MVSSSHLYLLEELQLYVLPLDMHVGWLRAVRELALRFRVICLAQEIRTEMSCQLEEVKVGRGKNIDSFVTNRV